ncbi:efflux RND transporter permease subunit [Geofilum sp. OHC36d9]|uniref:efflux RND transporter permease subunit n=1 Tax=Geofilum sp. OHC36d9 TaxID=3458413 RepID=UPI0040349E11
MLNRIIKLCLENRLVTLLVLIVLIGWGVINSPFAWETGLLPSDPVPVDAIPDLGENQQIVYTQWDGHSPQDIDDQITYPLTTSLLGIAGVKTIRSHSIFGVSSIYIIFEDDIDFYWSRTRILEKLNSLPSGTLPDGVTPSLGPDATALGQIYWYTLEGRDEHGNPAGGWDPQELRSIQDFYVKYVLTAAKGVSEVASIGGFVKEYQVDIDPNAMKAYGVNVAQIMWAVKNSNLDIGARTIEYNRAEYLIRAIGSVKNIEDLGQSVVSVHDNVPVRLKDVAHIHLGPAGRRGGLDKGGSEAVGGVVVARYGANPLQTIDNLKTKIAEIEAGLPSKTLADGSVSKVTIVPFYDRTGLIKETLGTLEEAISLELLISILVVIVLVFNLRASFLISSLLPIGVLITFILMRQFGVDANIVALSGIAIAIGVMVDVGIVFTESIIRHSELPENIGAKGKQLVQVVYTATTEVATPVITALATTIISFLPVFAMQAEEGKLFRPLAYTKTFTMLAALLVGLVIIPTLSHLMLSIRFKTETYKKIAGAITAAAGIVIAIASGYYIALALTAYGANAFFHDRWKEPHKRWMNYINIAITIIVVVYFLTKVWLPLGAQNSLFTNYLFVIAIIGSVLGALSLVLFFYEKILTWALANKWKFLLTPILILLSGITVWQGFDTLFGYMPDFITNSNGYKSISKAMPGIGKEFMPALNEGSFLFMPTTMPHSGVAENTEVIQLLDRRINSIPEVESIVGKWGRVNSALDPAPISMFENIINYKPEYILDEKGHRMRFKVNHNNAFELKDGTTYNPQKEAFRLIGKDNLISDRNGNYFRQWRKEITSPDDIWQEIIDQAKIPGLTSAPKLQPIATRLVMLQTGMRAPMGLKIYGPDLETIEKTGLQLEALLKNVKGVSPSSVFADRVVGKPYLEMDIKRDAISRYGISISSLQRVLNGAVGGMPLTTTIEGRERYSVRVRYARAFRDNPDALKEILIPTPSGQQIPLGELVSINYVRGPQLIKSENTFLVGYVIFDKLPRFAEVDVVENAIQYLDAQIESGDLRLPAGVSYVFTGNYENQIRATKRLLLVIPISLILIFLILYFQFKSVTSTALIFSGIIVALSGGFMMLWLYGQPWFLSGSIGGIELRQLFQVKTIHLSVAVWVGFIALFGVATDDGVLISTYIRQLMNKKKPNSVAGVRAIILQAGSKRVRPAIMTTATTIIALLPILTSTGKGSDIMVPMAIPLFGGMTIEVLTMFIVPVLYSMWQENKLKGKKNPA